MAGAGYKLFNTGDVLTAAQVNTYLQEQTVMVFASSTARTTALSGVLAEGMMSYLQDTNSVEVYNGSSWVALASGDLTEIVAGTGITVTSGTGPIPTVALTTPVAATNGGTAQSTYTTGDLLYASGTNTLAKRAIGTTGQVLTVSGGVPTWAVDPTTDVVTTAGDLIYGTAADTVTRLGIGTAGQVLTVNSGATAPQWATPAGGGSLTVLESGSLTGSSVTTNTLSTSYKDLRVVFRNYKPATDGADLLIRFNQDTGTNYTDRTVSGDFGFSRTSHNENFVLQDNTLAEGLATVEVPDYANTTTRKVLWRKFQSANLSSNTANMYMIAPNISTYNSTSAITKLTFFCSSGNFTSGDYIVYGVQ